MKNAVPHLHRDRHGTYYFRVTDAGKTIKRSLRTKNIDLATMRAACLNWQWDTMNRRTEPTVADIQQALEQGRIRKYDVELPNGVKLKNINNDDDNRRAKELIATIGPITQTITTRAAIPEAPRTLGPVLRTATKDHCKPQLRIQIKHGIAIGLGNAQLLEAIAGTGSISEVAELLEMSCRTAWRWSRT